MFVSYYSRRKDASYKDIIFAVDLKCKIKKFSRSPGEISF